MFFFKKSVSFLLVNIQALIVDGLCCSYSKSRSVIFQTTAKGQMNEIKIPLFQA